MNKRIVASIIAASILLIAIAFQSIGFFMNESFSENKASMLPGGQQPEEKIIERGSATKRIAQISLEGTIMNNPGSNPNPLGGGGYQHEQFIEKLETIKEDNSIKGVLLYVNSPGGGVYESAEIHDQLQEIKEAGKTIYVSMGGMAASGGYYISAPAHRIFASNETFTGSLGVIMQSINYQELANNFGVKFNTFKSGEFKDIMSPTKPMSDQERQIIQSLVDESYEEFVDVIAEGRNMPKDKVYDLADGRIYSGKQAVENGLVDEIGFQDDALNALQKEIGGDPQVIEYKDNSIGAFFDLPLAKSLLPNSEIRFIEQLISNRQGPTLMYMYNE
ncbi:signal peptide peptidase SppA [Halobacillus shinanisalinarum]|uniref:Signal peptide peptidase SppA n=1 Tax=Halobacillus shinanisalinarum TaxID=2932258 RepID=A0ABY4GVP9_9BACI|nr:signal peptide peptidase SppA [Halobacillus shinanisalinarum]UOQ92109.1 signal peptide peptidase SppA [Halobacillus shinanisalinarum]